MLAALENFKIMLCDFRDKALKALHENVSKESIAETRGLIQGRLDKKCEQTCHALRVPPYRTLEACEECKVEECLRFIQNKRYNEISEGLAAPLSEGVSTLRETFGKNTIQSPVWADDLRPDRLEVVYIFQPETQRFYAVGATLNGLEHMIAGLIKLCGFFRNNLESITRIPEFQAPQYRHNFALWGVDDPKEWEKNYSPDTWEQLCPSCYGYLDAWEKCLLHQPDLLALIRQSFNCEGEGQPKTLELISCYVKAGMLVLNGNDDGIREDFATLASTDMAKETGVRLRIHRRNEEAPIRPKSHLGEMMRDFTENADKEDSTSFLVERLYVFMYDFVTDEIYEHLRSGVFNHAGEEEDNLFENERDEKDTPILQHLINYTKEAQGNRSTPAKVARYLLTKGEPRKPLHDLAALAQDRQTETDSDTTMQALADATSQLVTAVERTGPMLEVALGAPSLSEPEPEHSIRRTSNGFVLRFNGKETILTQSKGAEVLFKCIERNGKNDDTQASVKENRLHLTDKKTIDAAIRELAAFCTELKELENSSEDDILETENSAGWEDSGKRERAVVQSYQDKPDKEKELRSRINKRENFLKENTQITSNQLERIHNGDGTVSTEPKTKKTAADKEIESRRSHLRQCIDKIEKSDPDAAQHLRHTHKHLCYTPADGVRVVIV